MAAHLVVEAYRPPRNFSNPAGRLAGSSCEAPSPSEPEGSPNADPAAADRAAADRSAAARSSAARLAGLPLLD